jgi:hypothetical protein
MPVEPGVILVDNTTTIEGAQTENGAMEHVTRALEAAISWNMAGDDLRRKLSSVQFAAKLFQRQTERMLAFEEHDRLLDAVGRRGTARVDQMVMRVEVRNMLSRLDRASPADLAGLKSLCGELQAVVDRILNRSGRDDDLLVEAQECGAGGQS